MVAEAAKKIEADIAQKAAEDKSDARPEPNGTVVEPTDKGDAEAPEEKTISS